MPEVDERLRPIEYEKPAMRWEPTPMFKLTSDEARAQLTELRASHPDLRTFDTVTHTANSLFDCRYPRLKANADARAAFVEEILNQGDKFGTWVYFPWDNSLVRYPDQSDLRMLRTNRERNIRTDEQQDLLYRKTVMFTGLSVGSNALMDMVYAGIGGTIIMCDFDTIDPTNLNRIRATFKDVGLPKLDTFAKKISEIDPYVRQIHLPQGFRPEETETLASIHIDLIIEEVDDPSAKVLVRQFAQQQKVPVIMATDLGEIVLLDTERHDRGARPFNGKLSEQEMARLAIGNIADDEKIRVFQKLAGVRHLRAPLIQSVLTVGSSLPGIPQPGTTAFRSGTDIADVARDILLGREVKSGRKVDDPRKTLGLENPVSRRESLKAAAALAKFVVESRKKKKSKLTKQAALASTDIVTPRIQ